MGYGSVDKTVFITDFMKIKMTGVTFKLSPGYFALYYSNNSCHYTFNLITGVIT